MPKRKAGELLDDVVPEPRRSSRRVPRNNTDSGVTTEIPTKSESKAKSVVPRKSETASDKHDEEDEDEDEDEDDEQGEPEKEPIRKKASKPSKTTKAKKSKDVAPKPSTDAPTDTDTTPSGHQYWLMKAEPESRLEKGHDIKFSIDDLASKTGPEPWDGIRSYSARNNLRAMKKGDLAFFYHSSCKVPAIVGVMEIVEEHTPDLSAHDPSAPYHDPSSTPSNPKWSLVHVTFRQKLKAPITLKELKAWQAEKGNPLEDMQMLKLARLSVSKVSQGGWEYLVERMRERGDVVEA